MNASFYEIVNVASQKVVHNFQEPPSPIPSHQGRGTIRNAGIFICRCSSETEALSRGGKTLSYDTLIDLFFRGGKVSVRKQAAINEAKAAAVQKRNMCR